MTVQEKISQIEHLTYKIFGSVFYVQGVTVRDIIHAEVENDFALTVRVKSPAIEKMPDEGKQFYFEFKQNETNPGRLITQFFNGVIDQLQKNNGYSTSPTVCELSSYYYMQNLPEHKLEWLLNENPHMKKIWDEQTRIRQR